MTESTRHVRHAVAEIADQEWTRDDGHVRTGPALAEYLERVGAYVRAEEVLAASRVGDVLNSGVACYVRTK